MDVILLERIRNLGFLGEKVKVKSGYARNYLIPQGKAVYATAANVVKFEQRRLELEKIAQEKLNHAKTKQQALNALPEINIIAKAGEEGKLYGSIGTRDIVELISKAGIEVEKRDIVLSTGPIRTLGLHEIVIELEDEVKATVKLNIVSTS